MAAELRALAHGAQGALVWVARWELHQEHCHAAENTVAGMYVCGFPSGLSRQSSPWGGRACRPGGQGAALLIQPCSYLSCANQASPMDNTRLLFKTHVTCQIRISVSHMQHPLPPAQMALACRQHAVSLPSHALCP